MFIIAGLGNPGEEYKNTRHNTGRLVLEVVAKKRGFDSWCEEGKIKALVAEGKIGGPASPKTSSRGGQKVIAVLPNNFMNNSGKSLPSLIKSKKDLSQLIVIY